MEFRKQFVIQACIAWMACAAPPMGVVATAFDRPAVAERNSPMPSSGVIQSYGNVAFRQWATKAAFSPDGRWLAAGDSKTVTLFDAQTGEVLLKYPLQGGLAGLDFSPDGRSLAIVDSSSLLVCDAKEGADPERVPAKNAKLGYLKFSATSPDRKWRATMPNNKEVGIGPWDQTEPAHKIPFKSGYPRMAMGNEGKWLATADPRSYAIQIWKAPKFDAPEEWKATNASISAMAAAPDGETFYVADSNGSIKAWNVTKSREGMKIAAVRRAAIHTLAVSQKGTYLAAATDSDVTIYETKSGRRVQTVNLSGPTNFLTSLAFSPDEKTLAIGPHERPLELWGVKTGRAVHHADYPRIEAVFAMNDPGRFGSHNAEKPGIYASTKDFSITFWNRETGRPEDSFPLNPWRNQNYQHVDVVFRGAEQLIVKTTDWEVYYRDLRGGKRIFSSWAECRTEPSTTVTTLTTGKVCKCNTWGLANFVCADFPFRLVAREELPIGMSRTGRNSSSGIWTPRLPPIWNGRFPRTGKSWRRPSPTVPSPFGRRRPANPF